MIKFIRRKGSWRHVADAARTTVGMDKGTGEPRSWWKKNMLLAEHSPVRKMGIEWKWEGIKRAVSDHFVRHKIGIEHFVSTGRPDRTGEERGSMLDPTNHEADADFQAIINISRKRLCTQAELETKVAWLEFLGELEELEPELHSVCVPECIYRGFCPELKCCGYVHTDNYAIRLEEYREVCKNA